MTTGSQNLNTQITTRLAASPTGLSCCQLEGARDILECASVVSVASVAALPDAAANQGRFFFVENICAYRFSDGAAWTNTAASQVEIQGSTLWTWGCIGAGRLGAPAPGNRSSPGTTSGCGTTWCAVGGKYSHTTAVKTDGTLWTWGCNNAGQLGDGTFFNRVSPGTTVGGGTTWCQVSTGGIHTAAVKTDGTLWTWGYNVCGRLGDGTVTTRCSPGNVCGAGTTWCQTSTGCFHTTAVKTNGTLWTWGSNGLGRLGDNTTTNRSSPGTTAGGGTTWCQVNASSGHTAAVKTDGTLWTWGLNQTGQLGRSGGTYSSSSPATVTSGGAIWCQASSGNSHGAGIKTDGTVQTWGDATAALGCGSAGTGCRAFPVNVTGGGTTWCSVSTGNTYMTAVKTDGTLWSWGYNAVGQLGDGTVTTRCVPVTPAGGGTTWCAVSGPAALKFSYKGFTQLP
jgi:alpha-tubulin suppressor-like RCC1 family protein